MEGGDDGAPTAPAAERTEAQLKMDAAKAQAQAEAAAAAAAGKKEGKKKMGYLARGVKSKYLEKAGNLQLPEEEQRRRAEYMQPLLDSLKTAKGTYAAVRDTAEKAIANSKASAAAQIDFALAVCDTEYLKESPCAGALPSFQEAHHELSKISATFIETVQTRVLDVAVNSVTGVDDARGKKEAYYEERQNYDFALLKLQEAAKKMVRQQLCPRNASDRESSLSPRFPFSLSPALLPCRRRHYWQAVFAPGVCDAILSPATIRLCSLSYTRNFTRIVPAGRGGDSGRPGKEAEGGRGIRRRAGRVQGG